MKELERYCDYVKEGHKFIITKIHDELRDKIDNRVNNGGNRHIDYPQYRVSDELQHSAGVYKITLDDNIYIGSTTYGFRKRFIAHVNTKSVLEIYNMLQSGAKFEVIWSCKAGEYSEEYIRNKENKYIEVYKKDDNWNLININNAWAYSGEHKIKVKYTNIRIEKRYHDEVLELLSKHGYLCKPFRDN